MANIKFFTGMDIPLELHKVRMVQKLNLQPVERRAAAIAEAGNTLTKSAPFSWAQAISDGVNAPGIDTRPFRFVSWITSRLTLGDMM